MKAFTKYPSSKAEFATSQRKLRSYWGLEIEVPVPTADSVVNKEATETAENAKKSGFLILSERQEIYVFLGERPDSSGDRARKRGKQPIRYLQSCALPPLPYRFLTWCSYTIIRRSTHYLSTQRLDYDN